MDSVGPADANADIKKWKICWQNMVQDVFIKELIPDMLLAHPYDKLF